MISFSEWRKQKKIHKKEPVALKNKDIDSFLQSVDGLAKELTALDGLEKKNVKKSPAKPNDANDPRCKPV